MDHRGYCAEHKDKEPRPFSGARRAGNSYSSMRWIRLRDKIIERDKCCVVCGSTIGLQVHHMVAHRGDESLFYDEDNLVVLCSQCHRLETIKEIVYRKRMISREPVYE